jgi:hypothetical protein
MLRALPWAAVGTSVGYRGCFGGGCCGLLRCDVLCEEFLALYMVLRVLGIFKFFAAHCKLALTVSYSVYGEAQVCANRKILFA